MRFMDECRCIFQIIRWPSMLCLSQRLGLDCELSLFWTLRFLGFDFKEEKRGERLCIHCGCLSWRVFVFIMAIITSEYTFRLKELSLAFVRHFVACVHKVKLLYLLRAKAEVVVNVTQQSEGVGLSGVPVTVTCITPSPPSKSIVGSTKWWIHLKCSAAATRFCTLNRHYVVKAAAISQRWWWNSFRMLIQMQTERNSLLYIIQISQ